MGGWGFQLELAIQVPEVMPGGQVEGPRLGPTGPVKMAIDFKQNENQTQDKKK